MARVDPDDDVEPTPSRPSRPLRAREAPPVDDLEPEEFEDFEDDEPAPRVVSRTPALVASNASRRDSMLFTIALVLIAANVVVDAVFIWLVLTR